MFALQQLKYESNEVRLSSYKLTCRVRFPEAPLLGLAGCLETPKFTNIFVQMEGSSRGDKLVLNARPGVKS
jgi:hypothetical protein